MDWKFCGLNMDAGLLRMRGGMIAERGGVRGCTKLGGDDRDDLALGGSGIIGESCVVGAGRSELNGLALSRFPAISPICCALRISMDAV